MAAVQTGALAPGPDHQQQQQQTSHPKGSLPCSQKITTRRDCVCFRNQFHTVLPNFC
jgi:hypothetical protein